MLFVAFALVGCNGPPPMMLLVNDLTAVGVPVQILEAVPTDPFDAQGMTLCVAGGKVRTYTFPSALSAQTTAESIDPDDPSLIDRGVVDWLGEEPKFWHRPQMLVLYTGTNPAVEMAITQVSGPPFARGSGRPFDEHC